MGPTATEDACAMLREAPQARPSEDWEGAAHSWLSDSDTQMVHLIGVGNSIRQDDAVGLEVVSSLRRDLGSRPSSRLWIHAPSLNPERIMSKAAARGEKLMVFDAVEANRPPGTILSACLADTKFGFFATHNIPLKLVPEVAGNLEAAMVIGIQPGSVDVGEGLSDPVKAASGRVVAVIAAIIGGGANGHS